MLRLPIGYGSGVQNTTRRYALSGLLPKSSNRSTRSSISPVCIRRVPRRSRGGTWIISNPDPVDARCIIEGLVLNFVAPKEGAEPDFAPSQ